MLKAFTVLLLFQLLGEITSQALNLPLPGPVLGMLFLFMVLWQRGDSPQSLQNASQTLLQHLSLLFIPAGVGVMAHLALLQTEWQALLITLLSSTLITMTVTAITLSLFIRHHKKTP